MSERSFSSIWDAIEDDPQTAQDLKRRSALMMALQRQMAGLSEQQAASLLGLRAPQVRALCSGKIDQFDLQTLRALAHAVGVPVETGAMSGGG